MDFLKKYRLEIFVLFVLCAIFLFTRIVNILSLPIFTDEAIYIRWSQIAKQDAAWRFISLTDGKQPSFIWATVTMMRVVSDPLLSGRLVSVFSGLATLIGLFFLGREVFKNRWVGIVSSFLYVFYPMAFVYDRMALYESLLACFSVWSLYLQILLVRTLRLDIALILGLVLGGGVLTKSSGFISIYLFPLTLFLFDWSHKERDKRLVKWIGLAIIATSLAYMYYSVLRLSPFFHIINEKNALFVYPLHEWVKHTFRFLYGNLIGLSDWFIRYTSVPLFGLAIFSFILNKSNLKEKIFLFLYFFAPFFALALFARLLYPRFIFFMNLVLFPLMAYSLVFLWERFKNKTIVSLLVLAIFSYNLWFDYLIVTDFVKAPAPRVDHDQYIGAWPAGGGIKEIVDFFKVEARDKKIYVATQGTFGLMPYALEIYLGDNKNVKIEGFWPINRSLPEEVVLASKKMPAYIVFYQPCLECPMIGEAPAELPLVKIAQYPKGDSQKEVLTLYKVR